ncbi:AMP-binding protein [Mycolicibacterium sp. HS_4_1]
MTMAGSGIDERLVRFPYDRAAAYRQTSMWNAQPTAERFHAIAVEYPNHSAVIAPDGSMTYAELDARTDQIAAALASMGLQPGQSVLFQLGNRLTSVLAWYAVLKAGLIPVATLPAHRHHEIAAISDKVGAAAHLVETASPKFDFVTFACQQRGSSSTLRHVFAVGGALHRPDVVDFDLLGREIDGDSARRTVAAIQAQIDPEDVAVYQLSGGTTGTSKVIPRLHAEYWNNALFFAQRLGRTEQSSVAHLLPFIHNAGIVCAVHGAHAVGATLVLPPAGLDAAIDFMIEAGVNDTLIGIVHTEMLHAARGTEFMSQLSTLLFSGSKLPSEVFDAAVHHGTWIGQLYGMAEGFFSSTRRDSPEAARRSTVGTPLTPGDEVRILDPDSPSEVADGGIGEVACRGPYTICGYFDEPDRNQAAFTPDGFYRTGDLGTIQSHNGIRYLSIEGRIKDVINRGGEKINAEEIELLLLQHNDIADAAVVAMPDERLGEKMCAYLVAVNSPITLDDARAHLRRLGVAQFKWPERLEWIDAIPRTNVSKTDKKALRQQICDTLAFERAAGSDAGAV